MSLIINPAVASNILDSLSITHVGLHSGVTGSDGSLNEITSISYARQPCSFSQATNGERVLSASVNFSMSGGDSVDYISYWGGSSFILSQQLSEIATFSIAGKFEVRAGDTVITL